MHSYNSTVLIANHVAFSPATNYAVLALSYETISSYGCPYALLVKNCILIKLSAYCQLIMVDIVWNATPVSSLFEFGDGNAPSESYRNYDKRR